MIGLALIVAVEAVCLYRLWQEQERQAYRVQAIYQILWEMERIKRLEEEDGKRGIG